MGAALPTVPAAVFAAAATAEPFPPPLLLLRPDRVGRLPDAGASFDRDACLGDEPSVGREPLEAGASRDCFFPEASVPNRFCAATLRGCFWPPPRLSGTWGGFLAPPLPLPLPPLPELPPPAPELPEFPPPPPGPG